jgi:hypothetical protein
MNFVFKTGGKMDQREMFLQDKTLVFANRATPEIGADVKSRPATKGARNFTAPSRKGKGPRHRVLEEGDFREYYRLR